MTPMSGSGRLRPLPALEGVVRLAGAALMLAMMMVTVVDVIGRKIGYPIGFAFEAIQVIVGLAFYIVLPAATARRVHVTVDLLPLSDGRGLGWWIALFRDLFGAFVLGWCAWTLFGQAASLAAFDTVLMFTRWPLAPIVTAMGVLAALTALVCLGQAGLRIAGGRGPVPEVP